MARYRTFHEFVQFKDRQNESIGKAANTLAGGAIAGAAELVSGLAGSGTGAVAKGVLDGATRGVVGGTASALADVVEKVAASIILGPDAARYFDKRRLHHCLGVIMEFLSELADTEERDQAVNYMWSVTQQHLNTPDKEEPFSMGWKIASRTIMPAVRGLSAALWGVLQTVRKTAAYADPITRKRDSREGGMLRNNHDACMKEFATLLAAMKQKDRQAFFERLRKEVAYLQEPTWGNWYDKNIGE